MSLTAIQKPAPSGEEAAAADAQGGGKKKIVVILLVAILVGAAAYWFVLRPKPESAPKPGEVVTLEPIQINLAAEHYLRLGLALQLEEGVKEVDGSKALDAAIEEFSGRPIDAVNAAASRHKLKEELEKELEKRYDGEVMGVYFTEFVTQ